MNINENGCISIKKYSDGDKDTWNSFNSTSKNYLFMFDRNYMEYHSDRFIDHSLLFYYGSELISILPMCQVGSDFISHGGLTYGGFISGTKMKQHIMNACFDGLLSYAKDKGIVHIIYKTIPHIYHNQPAEEDRYALFSHGAKLLTIDASTYINLSSPIKMPKGRKAQISRARREDVEIELLSDKESYEEFIILENDVLVRRHGTRAVHSAEELKMLHDRFPENIHLFTAKKKHSMIAGVVVFEYDQVIHTQYMAANDEARQIGALDLTIDTIIEKYRASKKWLDFGISTEHGRIYLNEGLISQKEGFGGRTGVYETWILDINAD